MLVDSNSKPSEVNVATNHSGVDVPTNLLKALVETQPEKAPTQPEFIHVATP